MTSRDELVRNRRVQYERAGLSESDLAVSPVEQWHHWYEDAVSAGVAEPNAMIVTTVDLLGRPDARVVLARGVDEHGFIFFTNYDSPKGVQLESEAHCAAVFAWLDLHRQVRVRGVVQRVSEEESDAYFASRPRESQIGAWASPQSQVIAGREELAARVSEVSERFAGLEVPRPSNWGGYRLVHETIEFWQGRSSRLHDRFVYTRSGGAWTIACLAP